MNTTSRRILLTLAFAIAGLAPQLGFSQSVALAWDPTTKDVNQVAINDIVGYDLLSGSSASSLSLRQQLRSGTTGYACNTTTCTYSVIGLSGGTTYYFAVRSVRSNGLTSANSNIISFTTGGTVTTTTVPATTTTTTRAGTTTTTTTTVRASTTTTSTNRPPTTTTSTTVRGTTTTTTRLGTTTTTTPGTTTTIPVVTTTTVSGTTTTTTQPDGPPLPPPPGGEAESCIDYNGDKIADLPVADLGTTTGEPVKFHIMLSDGNVKDINFGTRGDRVASGDYDGDGKADPTIIKGRSTALAWSALLSSNGTTFTKQFNLPIDYALSGCDFDNDGKSDIAGYDETKLTLRYVKSSTGRATGLKFHTPAQFKIVDLTCEDLNADGFSDLITLTRGKASTGTLQDVVTAYDVRARGKNILRALNKGNTLGGVFAARLVTGNPPTVAAYSRPNSKETIVSFYTKTATSKLPRVSTILLPPMNKIVSVGGASVFMLSRTGELLKMDLVKDNNATSLGLLNSKGAGKKLKLVGCKSTIVFKVVK